MVEFLQLVLLLLAGALSLAAPKPGSDARSSGFVALVRRFAAKQGLVVALIGCTSFLGCLGVAAYLHEPVPRVPDEFSYLVLGDTFASGRVANPPPSLPEFFDTLDVLDRLLIGTRIGRIVGAEAMKFDWPRLNSEYAQQFGIETPSLRLRKQAQEYEEAKQIQQALMPKEIPQIPGLEISGSWRPARIVGGDYFDVYPFGASRIGLCIADVSGKGMPAALLMSNLQAVVKGLAAENTSPKELLEKVNRVMWRNTTEAKFITLFYGLLDVNRKTLKYVNAGHNAPVLTREDGVQVRLEQGGLIVGAFEECVCDQGEIDLRPGDRLVMFTDGLSEAVDRNGEEFGEKRLAEAARCNRQLSAEALHRCLLDRVTDFCGGEFGDDATVLVIAVSQTNRASSAQSK